METSRKQIEPDPYLSLNQAALELGEGREAVLQRIVAGELTGSRVASRTVVTRESVARLKAEKEKAVAAQ